MWASSWLGRAWSTAALTDREPEHQLCLQVSGRACTTPSPRAGRGRRADAGRARRRHVDAGRNRGDAGPGQPVPGWHTGCRWTPAWRAVDVYGGERVLLIDYVTPPAHAVGPALPGRWPDDRQARHVLEPSVATGWDELCEPTDVPMPMQRAIPVTDVLGDLAHALRVDMTWPATTTRLPRHPRPGLVPLRTTTLPDWPDHARRPNCNARQLIQDFATDSGRDDQVSRSLAELLLDYGEGYIGAGPLCWSPGEVMVLLTDWLPQAILDADQRAAPARRAAPVAALRPHPTTQAPSGSARSSTRSTPTYPSSGTPSTAKSAWGP